MNKNRMGALLAAWVILGLMSVSGQTPTWLNFQGRLLDSNGQLVNSTVSISVSLYTNSLSGSSVYQESIGPVLVKDGMYSFQFGADKAALMNALRKPECWLEVTVNSGALLPRQRLAASPYAVRSAEVEQIGSNTLFAAQVIPSAALANGAVVSNKIAPGAVATTNLAAEAQTWKRSGSTVSLVAPGDEVRIGVSSGGSGALYVETAGWNAIKGNAQQVAVRGDASSSIGVYGYAYDIGVWGYAWGANNGVLGRAGQNFGVYGQAENNYGVYGNALYYGVCGNAREHGVVGLVTHNNGVRGYAGMNNGVFGLAQENYGVHGIAYQKYGVYGRASQDYGVYGTAPSNGVYGIATNHGVYGYANNSYGVYGYAYSYGVGGKATYYGMHGNASYQYGVYGSAFHSYGVAGAASNIGVYGAAIVNNGVEGQAANYGVYGNATNMYGVYGFANRNYGVYGKSAWNAVFGNAEESFGIRGVANQYGVYGEAVNQVGVYGVAPNRAVFGYATMDNGVVGSAQSYGVAGSAFSSYGVYGNVSAGNYGVYGQAQNYGVYGNALFYGVYGNSSSNFGVMGFAAQNRGVSGHAGHSYGVHGYAVQKYGVYGNAANYAILGEATGNFGVWGSAQNKGIYGYASIDNGVYGYAANRYGGYFESGSGNALYCNGNASVNGRVVTRVIQIVGGADFSEQFDVRPPETGTPPAPGLVVSIDPDHPGALMLSHVAYDKKAVGIISGAGGLSPGMMMSHEGTQADGKTPVALTGRVYCWVDATPAPIEPGDLLTTSDTPGHAMKALDLERARGTILGKAMTPLASGRGLILVLVRPQ